MTRSRPIQVIAATATLPLAALALGACGSGGGAATAAPSRPKTTSGAPATVGIGQTSLGNVLIDSEGRTLYLFKADTGTKSTCVGACATAWPPLRATGKPTVGRGANPSLIGTTTRADGKPQVTYNGHPLYLYQGDRKPGQTSGQAINAFGAAWFALSDAGNQISAQPSRGSGGNSPGIYG